MTFLSPWFLLGGLAIGLPLWLHLLERENPVRLPFSSLMFFEKRTTSSVRERRLRYLLLLALRLALYSLLALAFAKPIWERAVAGSLGGFPQLHLLVMDTSLSMNFGDRWQNAVAAAEQVIDNLSAVDRAQVLATGPSVRVITQATGDRAELRSALVSLEPSASRNSYGDLSDAVRSLAPAGDVPVVLHVFSDFQHSAMPSRFSDLTLPTIASLEVHSVAEEVSPNWAVESIRGTTRLHGDLEPRIEVIVVGFDTERTRKQVTLKLAGKTVASQPIDIPASGRASVVFENFTVPVGNSRGKVALEPGDDLPLDDRRLLAIEHSEPAGILFVSSDPRKRDLLYYQAALDASAESPFRVAGVAARDADRAQPEQYALVVLSDVAQLSSLFRERLESFVKAGGAVLIALGPKTALVGRLPLGDTVIGESRLEGRPRERFQLAGQVEESHPVLRTVERFRGVKFFRYLRVPDSDDDYVPARLSDGTPLLVERDLGRGKVMILASALDNVWNDLPVHPVFVPFVVESARYLTGLGEDVREIFIDSILELGRGRRRGAGVQVFAPDAERVLSLAESVEVQDVKLTDLGFYEVRRGGETELVAVNPDPRESNLRGIEEETLSLWQATGRSDHTALPAKSEETAIKPPPLRIWRLVLLLLVLVSLVESIVGNWHLSVQREV